MRMRRPLALPLLVAFAAAGLAALAQEDDLFAFIPPGGRSLLEMAEATALPDGFADAVATDSGDPAHWRAAIEASGGLGLQSWEADTVAQYLAAQAPFSLDDKPWDGRDLAMQRCQSCHIITVTITQNRPREAWLGTLRSPSHIEIEMSEAERGLLADYLVINAGIPIDDVPPELRAGGASY